MAATARHSPVRSSQLSRCISIFGVDWITEKLFFEYLSSISEPLRLRDFHSYARELGLPEFHPPMAVSYPLPFLAAPIRHLGESVGAFYVGEKELEFTPEDEETLVMFASQAALVIANARRHREVRRAGGLPRGCLRHGRGQRDSGRAAAAPVSEVLPHRRRRPETGHRGVGPGPRHLQGDSGDPRGPDMGRERRAWPGKPVHLHDSGGSGLPYRGRQSPGAL